jgi:hypothetical protein
LIQLRTSFLAAALELFSMSWPTRSRVSSVAGAVAALGRVCQYCPPRSSMVWGSMARALRGARAAMQQKRSVRDMAGILV